ncbi:hypothetical protein pah_c188o055 [Parachlamydia acanthamoebae str. Hall's coccus]|nr:hypothetical protein pah_c188o055 [Parachlamydia acanthamoebae str. Hall's coccus]
MHDFILFGVARRGVQQIELKHFFLLLCSIALPLLNIIKDLFSS